MEKADRVDTVCNPLHIACLLLLKLEKLDDYRNDISFVQLSAGFRGIARRLMAHIREKERPTKC